MPVVIGLIIVIAVIVIVFYNGLQVAQNNVKNAWSQIDVQLQRRFDLIPNLMEAIKGYMDHEEGILTKITELRSLWANSQTVSEKSKLNNDLSSSLKTIMAISENYPILRASENFLNLQNELRNTEEKIAVVRGEYNDAVTKYNIKLETVPSNLIAGIFGFKEEELFKLENEDVKKNVKIDFSK